MDEKIVYSEYLTTINQLVKEVNIDSFAHIDYPLRTSVEELKYEDYKMEFDTFFNTLIEKNICLELNTSRLDLGEKVYNNILNIYRSYRLRGGQYVTLGSDAHEPEEIADNFDIARRFLEQVDLIPIHFVKRKMVIDQI